MRSPSQSLTDTNSLSVPTPLLQVPGLPVHERGERSNISILQHSNISIESASRHIEIPIIRQSRRKQRPPLRLIDEIESKFNYRGIGLPTETAGHCVSEKKVNSIPHSVAISGSRGRLPSQSSNHVNPVPALSTDCSHTETDDVSIVQGNMCDAITHRVKSRRSHRQPKRLIAEIETPFCYRGISTPPVNRNRNSPKRQSIRRSASSPGSASVSGSIATPRAVMIVRSNDIPSDSYNSDADFDTTAAPRDHVVTVHPFGCADTRNSNAVEEHSLGLMDRVCPDCNAFFFQAEAVKGKYTKCCNSGKTIIEPLPDVPPFLEHLLKGESEESKRFMKNSRNYNNGLALCSMGFNYRKFDTPGVHSLVVNGQVMHYSVPLYAHGDAREKFAQLYFIDPTVATRYRQYGRPMRECDASIMRGLDSMLRESNQLLRSYQMLHEYIECERSRSGREPDSLSLCFINDATYSSNAYQNARLQTLNSPPVCDEVAVIFDHNDGAPPYKRDLCVYPWGEKPHQISPYTSLCDPLCYILLFPYGTERGWSIRRKIESGVTLMKFYAYRCAVRNDFSTIHRFGSLSLQYWLDGYIKCEADRLEWIKRNQATIRAETYSGVHDFVSNFAAENHARIGKRVILPSGFCGSNRNMYKRYLDSMALVQHFGKPDLFITMTTNPSWGDISSNTLFDGQDAYHRPDLIARVFNSKLKSLLHEIVDESIFGSCIAYNYSIEFQKRGLPHAHILIYLHDKDKLRTKDDIDKYISAEIPSPSADPVLHNIILTHNIHGPCGDLNPSAQCMNDNGECVRKFPKNFCDETIVSDHGFPIYRRRSGSEYRVGRYTIDNNFVVPYSPYLSRRYNCHINVESCLSVKSIKYINKYINKQGYDCCTIRIDDDGQRTADYSEIDAYLNMRYVGPSEAIWRLLSFKMHDTSHAVEVLAVHLPRQNIVTFIEGNEAHALQANRPTTLMAWFELNKKSFHARSLLYTEVIKYYRFNKPTAFWVRRLKGQQHPSISRLCAVQPVDRERYALRVLLLNVRGAMSFDDLKRDASTGHVHETFQGAAVANGLLKDDLEWTKCLREASLIYMPSQMRSLFATILIHCNPSNPIRLWSQFQEHMIDPVDDADDTHYDKALNLINIEIQSANPRLNLRDYGLSFPDITSLTAEVVHDNYENGLIEQVQSLNLDQRRIYENVLSAVDGDKNFGKLYYIDGPGGTGKSYLLNIIIRSLTENDKIVLATAFTGIAATLLKGGKTVHSSFGIPVTSRQITTVNITCNSREGKRLKAADLIIVDEATLISSAVLDTIDLTLRDVMLDNSTPFGGKTILLSGDFRQCLPIINKGDRSRIVSNTIKCSKHWPLFKIETLSHNMRAVSGESNFCRWLLDIGSGACGERVQIPHECLVTQESDLIESVYGNVLNSSLCNLFLNRAILCTTNEKSIELNDRIVNMFEGTSQYYVSIDTAECDDGTVPTMRFPTEYLNSVLTSGLPPHRLQLKIGVPVVLIRNLNVSRGLCNGTKLIVTKLRKNFIEARKINSNEAVIIPRITVMDKETDLPFVLKRHQLPVRLAFCLTINKSQGQTFDKVGLHLQKQCFTHGQLYVAMSRARSFDGISVYTGEQSDDSSLTSNVVYQEIF